MKISKVGGIIAAASKKDAVPLMQLGSISIIKRIVITFQQAGVFPIVVITGADEDEVKYELAPYGVIFLRNENCEEPELFESVKIGLEYLKDKCDRAVFTPVNVPMFAPDTLRRLLKSEAPIATPSYDGHGGHPIVLGNDIIDTILDYDGAGGLRGAIDAQDELREWVDVFDEGIAISIHNASQLQERLDMHNHAILSSNVKISIEKETAFFNSRLKLLLYLIGDTGSVRHACEHMALSHGKAWNMINKLEAELGYSVVERQHGGSRGGNTRLTEKGENLLKTYQTFEENVLHYAKDEFQRLFRKSGLL